MSEITPDDLRLLMSGIGDKYYTASRNIESWVTLRIPVECKPVLDKALKLAYNFSKMRSERTRMRLIDADALRESIEWCKEQSAKCNDSYYDDMLERIDVQPTIDAVPVVRCEDCKYWGQEDPAGDGCECNRIGGWWLPEDYCSCGERREADEQKKAR